MGGVVNIITKMPEKREFYLNTGFGESFDRGTSPDDLRKIYLSYGDKFSNGLSAFISYGYESTNGYPKALNVQSMQSPAGITGWSQTTDNDGNPAYLIGDCGSNEWSNYDIDFKLGYDFSKTSKLRFSFIRTYYNYFYDNPQTYLKDASGNPVYSYGGPWGVSESSFVQFGPGRLANDIYNISFETEIGIALMKLTVGLNDENTNWYVSPGAPNYTSSTTLNGGPGQISSSPSQGYSSDIQFTLPLFSSHILTFGGSFKTDRSNTEVNNLNDWQSMYSNTGLANNSGGKDTTYAVFVQDEISFLNNLKLYIGFREDWWETFDGYANQFGAGSFAQTYDSRNASAFSPKLAVVYKPFELITLKASVGQAFRAPTLFELYQGTWSWWGYTWESNPALKPETTTSWDAGITQDLWTGAKFTARYFENYLKDLIYQESISPTVWEYINAGEAESKGVTIELEQRFDKWLRLFTNFTYTDGRITKNDIDPASVGKRLTYLPDKMLNAGMELYEGPFSMSLTGRYVSKIYSDELNRDTVNGVYTSFDPYLTADGKISYKINFATIYLSVSNIFNERYFNYYQAPGRAWFGGLEIKF
jgi:iron complex outermembrane receptor protein